MVGGAHRLCLQRGLAGPNDFAQALDFALEILRLRHPGSSPQMLKIPLSNFMRLCARFLAPPSLAEHSIVGLAT
jgi:hypothetical protein